MSAALTIKPLKRLTEINREVLSESTPEDFEIEYVDISNVSGMGRILGTETLLFGKAPSRARRLVRNGDTIISTVRTYLRAITSIQSLPPNLVVSTGFATLTPGPEIDGGFFAYLAQTEHFIHEVVSRSTGVSYPAITPSELGNIKISYPPLPTQRRIAAYLDRETAQIDALLAEKETLLELLEEKRASLISHAVTRGLNPKAKLKPSGIPWLGDVPVHWQLKPFRHVVSIASGQVDPRDDEFKQAILIAPNHIESGTGRIVDMETVIDQGAISGKYLVRKGEVIYSKIRPELRKACLAPQDCLCSADMYPMRTGVELLPEFLLYFLLGEAFSRLVVLESMRVAMPKVNREMLAPCAIPIPPIAEQTEITTVLRKTLSAIDSATQEIQTSITLLREKRSSLISAAVTGKMAVP
jgi:type I restriction enzyme, S subunit